MKVVHITVHGPTGRNYQLWGIGGIKLNREQRAQLEICKSLSRFHPILTYHKPGSTPIVMILVAEPVGEIVWALEALHLEVLGFTPLMFHPYQLPMRIKDHRAWVFHGVPSRSKKCISGVAFGIGG
jgi:hypothetical protein